LGTRAASSKTTKEETVPNLNLRRFTNADILRKINPTKLLEWLLPAKAYLISKGMVWPEAVPDGMRLTGSAPDLPSERRGEPSGMGIARLAETFSPLASGVDPSGLQDYRVAVAESQVTRSSPADEEEVCAKLKGKIDYDLLTKVFADPEPDMPGPLAESVFMIDHMATPEGMDSILAAQEMFKFTLDVGNEAEPADVAVQAWLQKPAVFERLHNEHRLSRPRSFLYFQCVLDTLPKFEQPSGAQIRALEERLDGWYLSKKRGTGCRVFAFPRGDECWFLVRHGLPYKREGAMQHGEATSVFYRPQKHDVLVYNIPAGELRMHACGEEERNEFCAAFGVHLFHDEKFFGEGEKYSLDPIIRDQRKCLAAGDVDGVERVTLKEVEFFFGGTPSQRVSRKSEDIFALVDRGALKWPDERHLTRATFEVEFSGTKKTRRVTIAGANKALYGQDHDSVLIERWLKARKFIPEKGGEDEGGDDGGDGGRVADN
jgi:hypothetical protein